MASRISVFLAELKRRKVYRVLVAYVVVGTGIIGVADAALPDDIWDQLQIPIVVLILVGFPIALVLAWAYEVKPEQALPADPGSAANPEQLDAEQRRSIVVLPFENLSPDPENAFFADGLTEVLITDLAKLRTLRVISRTSAMSLRGSMKDAPTIARDLNVRYALEGSVRRAGNSLRITAQLIDALTDTHLWAENYSGTLDDVFDLQEQLSRRIVDALRVPLSAEEDRHLAARPIPDVQAYEHYLRARPNIYAFDAPSIKQAQRDLEAGLEILGENVHLLKGLGMALFQQVNAGVSEDPGVIDQVEACALRIREVAPDDAASFLLSALGQILKPDIPEAVAQLREAYRRDPSDPDTILWLGVVSLSTGQMEVSGSLLPELHRVDPLAPLSSLLVSYLAFFQGRFKEAASLQEDSLRLGPEVQVSLWQAVRTFIAAGESDRAFECAESLRERDPGSPFTEASGLLVMGLNDKMKKMPNTSPALRTWAARDGEWAQYLSDAFAFGGDGEKAFEWLDLARKAGFFNHMYLAQHDPFIAHLRDNPEWTRLLDRVRKSHRNFEDTLQPVPLAPQDQL